MQTSIRVFCPATIANLSCGFDVLGVCLDQIGDEMLVERTEAGGVTIKEITGADLPLDAEKNVAGVAALAMMHALQLDFGIEITIHKRIKAGSGIGSSAASAAGVVVALNELLDKPLPRKDLVYFAMQGEKLASGAAHADNVAPALLGGFTLIRSYEPLDVIKMHTPPDLYATVIHPQIELKTSDSRSIIKQQVSLKKAIQQWGNLGGFVCGLYTEDYALIGNSLQDHIVEPLRSMLIPKFDEVKQAALANGALGFGISGSGPSIYSLCKGEANAKNVAQAMHAVYESIGVDFDIHVSPINNDGVKVL
ncbi:MAG: homoserine kinase [Saprospiraceae bacterium]